MNHRTILLPGATVKAAAEADNHAECVVQAGGVDQGQVTYDCSADLRKAGAAGFATERGMLKGTTEVAGLGLAAYEVNKLSYRVLDNDTDCRINASFRNPPPNAVEVVKAVVDALTEAALK